ncbi:MAG: hypothetical protein IKU72_02080 [Oscillospiraceae bacterium]|nr:hypothetical protein [Oscillospiraceae bacterium]
MENQYIGRGEHEEFVRRMEDEHRRMNVRIRSVEQKADTLVELTASVESIAASVKTLTEKVADLERKPAENWNTVVKAGLTAVGAALGGGLIGVLAATLVK